MSFTIHAMGTSPGYTHNAILQSDLAKLYECVSNGRKLNNFTQTTSMSQKYLPKYR